MWIIEYTTLVERPGNGVLVKIRKRYGAFLTRRGAEEWLEQNPVRAPEIKRWVEADPNPALPEVRPDAA